MSDFLHFLNTADAEALTKLPGVNTSLAENLISARPFDFIEDCLKVHGMGKNLLARAQTSFEQLKVTAEEHTLIPVEQQDIREETQLEKGPPVEETPTETKPSFGSRLGKALLWFFRALLRLILIVLVIGGIGAVIYYGVPFVNEKFVAPVEQNAVRVGELEKEVESLQAQLIEINSHIDGIEQSMEAHTASLETLTEMQTALEAQLENNNDRALIELKHEVMITRVLDMLARARLYLAQSNFGLAKEDVQSARDLLAELQSASDDEALSRAITRLDMALGNLPEFPVVASGDLEIAWQIMMTGESATSAIPGSTPTTMTVTPESTLAPPATVTATP
ncbi:MAG TPA: helix-hairpin-helix domain-containing protein [Anaerolineales bacterium]|nr:helix-hairpin-helix domain-containing protein [Anaerolineales bacterium]